jgi:hypothetical protein
MIQHPLEELEIAAYGAITQAMTPTIVEPVFRIKGREDEYLCGPYRITNTVILGGNIRNRKELDLRVAQSEMTWLPKPIPDIQNDWALWVDQEMKVHYQPRREVEQALSEFAKQCIKEAHDCLRSGDLDSANRLAGTAIAADDRMPEPLAIKATIRDLQGNTKAAARFRKALKKINTPRWRHTARVKNNTGIHSVFYGETIPPIGATCPGIAPPNKIVGYWRELPCSIPGETNERDQKEEIAKDNIIAELTNLASGLAISGDKLGSDICIKAINHIQKQKS